MMASKRKILEALLQQAYDSDKANEMIEDIEGGKYEGDDGYDRFKRDALRVLRLDGRTEVVKYAFTEAWADGHSWGYHDVFCHLQRYADVIHMCGGPGIRAA